MMTKEDLIAFHDLARTKKAMEKLSRKYKRQSSSTKSYKIGKIIKSREFMMFQVHHHRLECHIREINYWLLLLQTTMSKTDTAPKTIGRCNECKMQRIQALESI